MMMMRMAHPRCSADHENEASAEAGIYVREITMWIHCLPDFPRHPFPWGRWSWDPLERCHHSCSLPLWSALELPTGTSRASETVRGGSKNQAEAYANPVIKILQWMLILWKKPNHFIVCLISEAGEEPKSIQQNRSTLDTVLGHGRKPRPTCEREKHIVFPKHVTGVWS